MVDPRSTDIAVEAEAQIGREKLFAITGLDPNPIFSLFKTSLAAAAGARAVQRNENLDLDSGIT